MARARGWSLVELAERAGLSIRVIYYLRDGRQPSAATMEALMRVFPAVAFGDLFVSADSTNVQATDTALEPSVA